MVRGFVMALAVVGFSMASAAAQNIEDLKPGQTFPKEGYFPDEKKVVYVVIYHYKKRVEEFGFQDFFMNANGVNNTTADKIKEAMAKQYPNLTVYVKETNEKDVQELVNRERKRIKFVDKDWVDVKQPEGKIKMPKMEIVDKAVRITYKDDAPKGGLEGRVKYQQDKAAFQREKDDFKADKTAYNRDVAAWRRDYDASEKTTGELNRDVQAFNALPADQRTQTAADKLKRRNEEVSKDQAYIIKRLAELNKRMAELKKREAALTDKKADLEKREAALTDK